MMNTISKNFSIIQIIGINIRNATINFTNILHDISIIHNINFFIDLKTNFTKLLINLPPDFIIF